MAAQRKVTEAEWAYRAQRIQTIGVSINRAISWTGLGALGFFAWRIVESLSGQVTFADIMIGFFGDMRVNTAFAWLLAGAGVGYGKVQARLRRKTVARLTKRTEFLEQLVDPKRSSSQLTRHGTTNPEDAL